MSILTLASTYPNRNLSLFLSLPLTEQDGQPVAISYVLILGDNDLPALLKKPLVIPVRIQRGQLVRDTIVLPD